MKRFNDAVYVLILVAALFLCAPVLAEPGSGGYPISVVSIDRGGTMSTGGTPQTLAAANASRKSIEIDNPSTATGQGISAAEDLCISVVGSATVDGAGDYVCLIPGGSTVVTVNGQVFRGQISVNAATTGHRWWATEWQ